MQESAIDKIKEAIDSSYDSLSLSKLGLTEIPDKVFKMTNLTSLDLRDNLITTIPKEIENLTQLETLWLTSNELETLPEEISKLPKLRSVHISDNKLTELPLSLVLHHRISHLCLRGNNISVIPEEILESKIRDLQLSRNNIKELPITYDNADIFHSITLNDNPLESPPASIFYGNLPGLLKYLIEKDRGKTFQIPFQDELRVTFKQYLIYFKEYIEKTKGRLIGFEIRDIDEGLELEIKTENNTDEEINEIKGYMKEYVDFVKSNVDNLEPKFSVEVAQIDKNFIVAELRSQVRHLQSQLEFKIARNKSLEEDRDRYYNLLDKMVDKPIVQNLTTNNTNSQLVQNQFVNQVSAALPELLESLTELRKEIPTENNYVVKELEIVDEKLLELEDCMAEGQDVDKVPFKKLKRILEEINDEKDLLLIKSSKGQKKL